MRIFSSCDNYPEYDERTYFSSFFTSFRHQSMRRFPQDDDEAPWESDGYESYEESASYENS